MSTVKFMLTFIFVIFLMDAYSQDGRANSFYTPDSVKHITIETLYPGKTEGLNSDIQKKFKIPQKAINDNLHGQLIIEFIVDKDGKVSDTKIIKSLREDVDEAAIKMIYKLKRFTPAIMDNKPVPTTLKIPLSI